MKRFMKEAWAIIGYIVGLIGTFVTILTVSGTVSIGIRWLVLIGVLVVSAMILAVAATRKLSIIMRNGTRYKITSYGHYKDGDMYYTDYSNNLRKDTLVTIYYTKLHDQVLGYGIVNYPCYEENYTEIKIIYVENELNDIFEQSKINNVKALSDMYILPNTYFTEFHKIIKIVNGGADANGKN